MRLTLQIILFSLFLGILLIPAYLLSSLTLDSTPSNILFLIHRILGLYAFSLIFIQIILGSQMRPLTYAFSPDTILKNHMMIGKIAFTLALAHPILLYSTYFTEHNLSYISAFTTSNNIFYYSLGLTALTLLIISVSSAIFRYKIGPNWIYLHRLNYLIFWLIYFHALNLGIDTQTRQALNVFNVYAVVVIILTIKQIFIAIKDYLNKNRSPSTPISSNKTV